MRVGAPMRPEFAAWRYGDQFGRRRRKALRNTMIGAGVAGGVVLGSVFTAGGLISLNFALHGYNIFRILKARTTLYLEGGERLDLSQRHLMGMKLRPGGGDGVADSTSPWHLFVPHREGRSILTGQDAVRALRAVLPGMNAAGASRKDVQFAVREIEDAGGPEAYFADVEYRARKLGAGYVPIGSLPSKLRLTLEMAAHEDAERVAIEGELACLETAWREAEEIAAISDELTLSERVRIQFEELKAKYGRRAPDFEQEFEQETPGPT